jgi:hypothetical protein
MLIRFIHLLIRVESRRQAVGTDMRAKVVGIFAHNRLDKEGLCAYQSIPLINGVLRGRRRKGYIEQRRSS